MSEIEPARAPAAFQAHSAGGSAADKVATPPRRIRLQVITAAPLAPANAASEPLPPAPPAPLVPLAALAPTPPVIAAPVAIQANASQGQLASPTQMMKVDAIRQLYAEHHDEEAQRKQEAFQCLPSQWQLPADLQAHLRKP